MHSRGLVFCLLFFQGDASRSVRIDFSRHDAQRQTNTLANGLSVSAKAREALIPGGFGRHKFHRAGPQAGVSREGPEQDGPRAGHLELRRVVPFKAVGLQDKRFLFGPRRAEVVLQAASERTRDGLETNKKNNAILFDCDGVLADTEKDGHRPAFNQAFKEKGLPDVWDVELYGRLLQVGGGKERMKAYWNMKGWPSGYESDKEKQDELVKGLHLRKTEIFMEMLSSGKIPLRPGVLDLIMSALRDDVVVAVCSTSNEKAVSTLVRVLMGDEVADAVKIFAGDVVKNKKPAPDIYNLAVDTLGLDKAATIVVEDSGIGFQAATNAGLPCVVTTSPYTKNEEFDGAAMVVPDLVTGGVDLELLQSL